MGVQSNIDPPFLLPSPSVGFSTWYPHEVSVDLEVEPFVLSQIGQGFPLDRPHLAVCLVPVCQICMNFIPDGTVLFSDANGCRSCGRVIILNAYGQRVHHSESRSWGSSPIEIRVIGAATSCCKGNEGRDNRTLELHKACFPNIIPSDL